MVAVKWCRFGIELFLCLFFVGNTARVSAAPDPTKPFFSEVTQSKPTTTRAQLQLQAIYNRGGKMEAVINSILVVEGDYISGAIIHKIEVGKVHYTRLKKTGVLILNSKILKNLQGEG